MADLKSFAVHFAGMHAAIHELSDADLVRLHEACKGVSVSAGWWAEYQAGTYLMPTVEGEIQSRSRKAEATARTLAQQPGTEGR